MHTLHLEWRCCFHYHACYCKFVQLCAFYSLKNRFLNGKLIPVCSYASICDNALQLFFRLILERLHVSSRAVLFVSLLLNIVGMLFLVDWQYLASGDAVNMCLDSSLSGTSLNDSFDDVLLSAGECDTTYGENRTQSLNEILCTESEECYWNPDSIVTGYYCQDCPSLCHSKSGSLNFIQFTIGIMLVGLSVDICRYNTMPLMSKVTPNDFKVIYLIAVMTADLLHIYSNASPVMNLPISHININHALFV